MGNMSGSYGSHYTLRQSITQNSQSVSGNYSNVTVRLYLTFDGSSYYSYTNYQTAGNMVINGLTYNYTIASINFSSGQAKDLLLAEWTGNISHNSDGTKTLNVTGYWNTDTSRIGSGSCSASLALTTIPRASTVSCSTANIEEPANVIILGASDDFTHNVYANFGTLKDVVVKTGVKRGSYSWTIPTTFYAQIPDTPTGWGTIYCKTYSGSTLIGTSDPVRFDVTTSKSKCQPTVTGSVVDTNSTTIALTGDKNKLILYKSTAQVTINATAKNSATIKSKTINNTTVSGTTLTLSNVSTSTFTLSATDSRGYSYSETLSPSVIKYVPLTINATIVRPQPTTGEVTLSFNGNYYNGSFGAKVNELWVEWYYKKHSETDYAFGGALTPIIEGNTYRSNGTISLGTSYDYQQDYDFKVAVADWITILNYTQYVSVGTPVFNWGKDFFRSNVDTSIGGKLTIATGIDGGNVAVSEARDNATSFNDVATGGLLNKSGLYSVRVDGVWYNLISVRHRNGSEDGQKYGMQIRQAFGINKPLHIRDNSNGDWGVWKRIFHVTALYSNSSGTTGTVTLSASAANYELLEIFYGDSRNGTPVNSITVFSPNGKTADTAICSKGDGVTTIRINTRRLTISTTTITPSNYQVNYVPNGEQYTVNEQYIYKVFGYN